MVKIEYTPKHTGATNDYKIAYDLVSDLRKGNSEIITPLNIKAFRKYVYDLSAKVNKEFTTKKRGNQLEVFRIS